MSSTAFNRKERTTTNPEENPEEQLEITTKSKANGMNHQHRKRIRRYLQRER